MIILRVCAVVLVVCAAGHSHATLSVPTVNSPVLVDFTGFAGDGFSSTPSVGQLDSDTWRVTGLSDGLGTFGGTHATGDFSRGSSSGGESTGGIYAFNVGAGNVALGVQPGGSDFTPGAFTLAVENNTGVSVSDWSISYDVLVNNDQARGNSFDFSYSFDDSTYTTVSDLDLTSATASDSLGFQANPKATSITTAPIADGQLLYLRWTGDDVSGGGSRDEFALDNVSVTAVQAIPEAGSVLFGTLVCGIMGLTYAGRRMKKAAPAADGQASTEA